MFTFFIGKGGVGKTTVSSAYALWRAAKQPRQSILLLSTDPAHSLADALGVKLSDKPIRLSSPGKLWVRQLDAQKQIDSFLRREREGILKLLNKGSLFTRDELEPLLDTSLPGMAEVAALLAIHKLLDSDYDEVVVDTAPMGHAIRLFQMPEHFARFLDVLETAASRDLVLAQHFGGRAPREPALERWSKMVQQVEAALSADKSKLVLVTTSEQFSLSEAVRSAAAFQSGGNAISEIVMNRAVRAKTKCSRCRQQAKQSGAARKFLREHFPKAKLFEGDDPGCPLLGIEALRAFGSHIFEHKKLPSPVITRPSNQRSPKLSPAEWPKLVSPLTLTLGKGGVGKTTISAALAFHHRREAKHDDVSICSIDPAPSLDDVFGSDVGATLKPVLRDPKLRAAEFDAIAEFQQWAGELRTRLSEAMSGEERGIHVDLSLDRKFLLALLDVVPPGVDEIFATFRILDLVRSGERVVIDMAPTGHALEVLRTPERLLTWSRLLLKTLAAHRALPMARDAAVEVATLSQNVRELGALLHDGKRCSMMVVTLAEPLPDYETERLLRTLDDMKAPVRAVFVNRVLIGEAECKRCRLAAQWQFAALGKLKKKLREVEIFVAPEFPKQVAGRESLARFTRKVWRLE